MSERKRELIEESRSPLERTVIELAEAAKECAEREARQIVLVDADVAAHLHQKYPDERIPKPAIIRSWLRRGGLLEVPGRFNIGGPKARVCSALPVPSNASWPADLKPYRADPSDLASM